MQTPVFDTSEIIIEKKALDSFDFLVKVTLPSECIQKITSRLIEGGMPQTDDQLMQILVKVCVDEVFAREERPSVWGPAMLGGKPDLPKAGQDFSFEMMIDQIPNFEIPPFEDLVIRRPQLDISEDLVQQEIHSQRFDAADHQASDAPISTDNRVTIDLQIFSLDQARQPIVLNDLVGRVSDQTSSVVFNGLKFEDLNQALLGHVAGDVFEASISVPKVIRTEGFSGDLHKAKIAVQKVEVATPLSIDDVLKRYGTPNLVVLKSQIEASLERRFELDQMAFMTDDLFRQLLDRIDYSPPERVLRSLEFDVGQKAFKLCQSNGGSEDEAKSAAERAISSARELVARSAKRKAIVTVLCSQYQLHYSEDATQGQIRNLAALQGKRPEDYRQELIDSGQIHAITTQVLEQQITRLALGQAEVVDIDPE